MFVRGICLVIFIFLAIENPLCLDPENYCQESAWPKRLLKCLFQFLLHYLEFVSMRQLLIILNFVCKENYDGSFLKTRVFFGIILDPIKVNQIKLNEIKGTSRDQVGMKIVFRNREYSEKRLKHKSFQSQGCVKALRKGQPSN